ncbi:MAG: ABC transporter substrate-binding protein [Deltaproteobacteria bacterium]|jgi:iron complex transport system substrate-binding protein|nr:ABC transporter substrate-binding protein [Deltaproteobacteria bacterium]
MEKTMEEAMEETMEKTMENTMPCPKLSIKKSKKIATTIFLAVLSLLITLASPNTPAQAAADGPKIISLYAADTEILLRLGARDNLVGISRQETYDGPETVGWTRPPTFSIHDDVEKFLAASPDYVLLRPQHLATKPALFDFLEKNGIKLWTKQCTKASELADFWREIGQIANRTKEAEKMIQDFQEAVAKYNSLNSLDQSDKPGVFLESIHKEVKTFTPDSIPIWLITLAGGQNVASDAQPARPGLIVADYGPERLLEKAQEVDIFISQEGPMNPITLDQIKDRSIFRVLPAFQNDRVYRVPEELISRPTPSLLEGLELLSKQIKGQ